MTVPDQPYIPLFTQLLLYLAILTCSCLAIALPEKAVGILERLWTYLKHEYRRAWRLGGIQKWE